MSVKNIILIRIFLGGHTTRQRKVFDTVIGKVLSLFDDEFEFIIEKENTDTIRKKHWTTTQFTDWMEEADCHFILSHIHQGLGALRWNMDNLKNQLFSKSWITVYPMISIRVI